MGGVSGTLPRAVTAAARTAPAAAHLPLVLDLDGTLVRTDTLHESFLLLLKRSPLVALVLVPLWLLRGGKAHMKQEIGRRVALDAAHLPYHEGLLAHAREEKAAGRRVVLATAADRTIADAVAAHLTAEDGTPLFDDVLASDGRTNLSGPRKLAALQALLGGPQAPFEYAGDGEVDLTLWQASARAVLVAAPPGLRKRAEALGRPVRHFAPAAGRGPLQRWVKALRLHQWAKNALIFVPLLASHRAGNVQALSAAALAFLAFSLCASSVYVLNDLLDLPSDRRHHSKRKRPFAAGELSVKAGLLAAPVLLVAAFGLALWLLPLPFVLLLAGYYATTLAYSLALKQVLMLDVLLLAGLYTVRIFGGSLAVDVPTSSWLFTFSMFLFLSLALVKRVSEVRRLRVGEGAGKAGKAHGRGYEAGDWEQLASLGSASGYLAVLVLALYIHSNEVSVLYRHPERLWLLCPLLLYWVGRVWMLAHRGLVNEDPLVFALKDRVSYAVGAVAAAVVLLSA
jgi:4-hydroxybenzoate polyprenyltransferase